MQIKAKHLKELKEQVELEKKFENAKVQVVRERWKSLFDNMTDNEIMDLESISLNFIDGR